MTDVEQMTKVARERADNRIDSAIGELRQAAHKIGAAHDIPENIAGHSIAELLGRMTYVPSMARDLRRACGQELAKQEINAYLDGTAGTAQVMHLDAPASKPIEPSLIPGNVPVGMDIGDLDGISVQTIAALRAGGLNKIGEIVTVPDEHLIKMVGMGEKTVAHVRAAIAKASEPKT